MSFHHRLLALGFQIEGTGGNCDAYVRYLDRDLCEMITLHGDPSVPTSEDDLIDMGAHGEDLDAALDVYGVPLWAVLEALEGCSCYATMGLRWANRANSAHDHHCCKWS
jgi:hypothetical protein